MWMMGCRDGSGLNISDSINGRKLRPLIPRPTSSSSSTTPSTTTTTTTTSSSCLNRIHGNDLLSLHSHFGTTEHGKRELGTSQPVSSRWNPTPEQLRTLEDLYRRGTRTPTAEQIQYITAQLRRYGKIEGKNVFYWFQNHKARERQKRKRRIEVAAAVERNAESEERKDLDMNRKGFEAEACKSWSSPTNCSPLAEESALVSGQDCWRDAWLHCTREVQNHVPPDGHASWQMMHLCSLPSLVNTYPATPVSNATPTIAASAAAVESMFTVNEDFDVGGGPSPNGPAKTLELFPLRSDGMAVSEKMSAAAPAAAAGDFCSYQFIQFLPLKN